MSRKRLSNGRFSKRPRRAKASGNNLHQESPKCPFGSTEQDLQLLEHQKQPLDVVDSKDHACVESQCNSEVSGSCKELCGAAVNENTDNPEMFTNDIYEPCNQRFLCRLGLEEVSYFVNKDDNVIASEGETSAQPDTCENLNISISDDKVLNLKQENQAQSVLENKGHPETSVRDASEEADFILEQDYKPDTAVNSSDLAESGSGGSKKHTTYNCPFCEKTFIRRGSLIRHLEVHNNNRRIFQCSHCPQLFKSLESARFHHKKHIEEKTRIWTHNSKMQYSYIICKTCKMGFTSESALNTHKELHFIAQPNTNSVHNKIPQTFSNHNLNSIVPIKDTPVVLFTPKAQAVRENLDEQFVYNFKEVESRLPGASTSQGKKKKDPPYKCSRCDKSFRNSSKLRLHQRVHSWPNRNVHIEIRPKGQICNNKIPNQTKVLLPTQFQGIATIQTTNQINILVPNQFPGVESIKATNYINMYVSSQF